MSNPQHSIQEWKDSYDQAEIAMFREADPDLVDWPLAQFMCKTADTRDVVAKDPLIMQAIINMVDSEGFDGLDPETFTTILGTANGTTKDDFQELVQEHIQEAYGPEEEGRPDVTQFVSEDDWELWYRNHAMGPTEVYGDTIGGGTLYWFDRKDIW